MRCFVSLKVFIQETSGSHRSAIVLDKTFLCVPFDAVRNCRSTSTNLQKNRVIGER